MTTYYSKITYTVATETDTFAIPFEYLSAAHLDVSVDGVAKTNGVDYSIVGTNVVFGSNIAVNAEVALERVTPISTSELSVTFTDGSSIRGADLNAAVRQSIFVLQETADDATVLSAGVEGAAKKTSNLSDLDNLVTARTNLGVYSTAETTALFDSIAKKANNLSDLANAATARTNLAVYSAAETDSVVSTTLGNSLINSNNLSDLGNVSIARVNLDVYSIAATDDAIAASLNTACIRASNLSDVDSAATSRDNLDVYSKSEVDALIQGAIDDFS